MVASKGLTKALPLRMTDEERALIETVQDVYGRAGVQMSLNDTVRHLIRRGGIVVAHTPAESLAQIREHCEGCSECSMGEAPPASRSTAESTWRFGCPEGLFLFRTHRRVLRAHPGTTETDEL